MALKQQIYLGDEAFVERMQARVEPKRTATKEVPRAQRQRPRTLEQWMKQSGSREEALYNAYAQSGISMTKLAATLGLSVSRVSRLIAGEEAKDKT